MFFIYGSGFASVTCLIYCKVVIGNQVCEVFNRLLVVVVMMLVVAGGERQVRVMSGRVECGARVMVTVGLLVGLLLVIVWLSVFTPAAHVDHSSNSTAVTITCPQYPITFSPVMLH